VSTPWPFGYQILLGHPRSLTKTFKHPAIGVSEKVFATFAKEWVSTEPYMILSDIISSYNLGELEKLEEVGELLKLFGTPHGV
jgi:hypothetical protein